MTVITAMTQPCLYMESEHYKLVEPCIAWHCPSEPGISEVTALADLGGKTDRYSYMSAEWRRLFSFLYLGSIVL